MSPQVERFWQQIAEAYQPSAVELTIFVLLVALLIGGLVFYAVHRSRRERIQQIELSERLFAQTVQEKELSPSQIDLLRQMQTYLRDRTQVHQLVTDELSFNSAASRLREETDVGPQSVAALRVRLKFHEGRTQLAPRSSAAVPEGSVVLVARNSYRKPFRCRVLAPLPEAFRLQVLDEGGRLPPGASVDVFYQSSAGVFTFKTSVLAEAGGVAQLLHSEEVRRYQKRRYYRRKLHIPVVVCPSDGGECFKSNFFEIGGGGASLKNTSNRLTVGNEVSLEFAPADERLRVPGKVVRLSDGGRTAHIRYEQIKDPLRDKIYYAIFQPPEDERNHAQSATTHPPDANRRSDAHGSNVTE